MKVTIYELLGMIKDGKIPKKIKYHNYICYYDDGDYKIKSNDMWLFVNEYINLNDLNDEVEIIEEPKEHKIPEKLDIKLNSDDENKVNYYRATNLECDLAFKINEILDYLEEIE